MQKIKLIGIVLAVYSAFCYSASTTKSAPEADCSEIVDRNARLDCFDKGAGQRSNATDQGDRGANTKEMVATKKAVSEPALSDYRRVDSEDLFAAPNKYKDKPVLLSKARCFHADKNEYRCLGAGAMALLVIAPNVEPEVEKEALERDCGEIKKLMSSPRCVKNIRFVPLIAETDLISGYRNRVALGASKLVIESPSGASPRR